MVWIIGGGIYFVLLALSLAFLRGVSILNVDNERECVFKAISDKMK